MRIAARFTLVFVAATSLVLPRALAQSLPELGGLSDGALPARLEQRIGAEIMRDIRLREPSYLDDSEVTDYLNVLGGRLVAASPDVRQRFEFFAIRDSSMNAFALPGGYIGVHTGLITTVETESELASVLAHEVAHVTQRHIARLIGAQQQLQIPTMVALAAALLLGRSRPDLAAGAAAALLAGALQSEINYTRSFEREADRIGFQVLSRAGFDTHAMSGLFEKMQRS
ncbi:MAG: M48 family metalloprotease, partial [Proteobacteria bacterium]|nr:M48 family metalloprotease [Pseudomonadota bacterium]